MSNVDYYIGLISGTSIDGIDCALVQFTGDNPAVVATHCNPMPRALRAKILRLCTGSDFSSQLLGEVDVEIGRLFAVCANTLLQQAGFSASAIKAIGSHGQTVFHAPEAEFPFTLQIGDPNSIAQLTGITTVADFRRRDMVAGGKGAPLAPLLHRNCFGSESVTRIIVNIGGISNITVLNPDGHCFAFDTGPGNVLMDYWIEKHQDKTFDNNGAWAATGTVVFDLLKLLLQEPYFKAPHPKSTGRELFNGRWLESTLDQFSSTLPAEDVQATLLELTAATIHADVIKATKPQEIYICGGGAQNGELMLRLQVLFGDIPVASTEVLGVHPDWVEAVAFAWMAKQTLAGKMIDTTALTGAEKPVILGGIYYA